MTTNDDPFSRWRRSHIWGIWSWEVIGVNANGHWEVRAPFTSDESTPESVYKNMGR